MLAAIAPSPLNNSQISKLRSAFSVEKGMSNFHQLTNVPGTSWARANAASARMSICARVLVAVAAIQSIGCAHISFHDSTHPERNLGVEYYKPKLFLLLTSSGVGAYKADILTLPDLSQPRYALLHSGYGANNLSLKLNNGILTDVGQQTDTQIPQTITALGSLATALVRSAAATPPTPEPFQLFEINYRDGQFEFKKVRLPGTE